MTAPVDPYADARPSRGFLDGLSPLAKLAGPLPAMLLLVFVRDVATPLAFLVLSYLLVLAGSRVTGRVALLMFVGMPVGAAVIGIALSLWADPASVGASTPLLSIGRWTLSVEALESGMATGARLVAILALALIAGVTTTGADLVRALVQQLRLPYRIGYTALAAFRFVPRFGYELEIIRQAHRVRGAAIGRGPVAAAARWWGYIVPLLAGAIRHAERVALAMDARAFGAHDTRTERHLLPWRRRDTLFTLAMWVLSAGISAVLW
ncbi:energy-coupling factor transporter transmembrane protein EcfT [Microbacterium sp. 179-B 1A2 NHS]|uniref:energy-coupling factor transporter transmembrane component T family protein n=1 Tax=Microbacterium sp. 179-B 1A2 NHS TaxID=3142383 RepID=UPI0039A34297